MPLLKQICFVVFLSTNFVGFAQSDVIDLFRNTINTPSVVFPGGGRPLSAEKYSNLLEGSPYYSDSWAWGSVLLKDSSHHSNIKLRLNLVENAVEYIDKNGAILVATSPIRELKFIDSVTGNSVRFIHSSAINSKEIETGWYKILVQGKAHLYKRYIKELRESKSYGSATSEQRITTQTQYYLLSANTFTKIKKTKELPALLPDKQKELASKKTSGNTEADLSELVTFYNQ